MNTKIIAALAAIAFALPFSASAATLDGQAIFPGNQNQVWENPNDSVSIKTAIQANSGEVVHAIEYNFIDGGNLTSVCKDVSNFEGAQKRTVTQSVNVPPNTGDYGLEINVFTADNMQEANARNGSAACQGDNDQVYSEGNVVHVVPNGSSNNNNDDSNVGGNEETSTISQLMAQIAVMQTQINCYLTGRDYDASTKQCKDKPAPPEPTKPAYCSTWITAASSGTFGLQQWLVNNGFMTQAAMQTGPGIYGPKTTAASASAQLACR